jgi:ArsR family transcriptional regulator
MENTMFSHESRLLRILGSRPRLLIIDALSKREHNVTELVGLLGCDQTTCSKHLAILKAASLVEDRREGSKTFYRLKNFGVINLLLHAKMLARQ